LVPICCKSNSAESPATFNEIFTDGVITVNPTNPYQWMMNTIASSCLAQPMCFTWASKFNRNQRPTIIGISGATRSGKGTVSYLLKERLGNKCSVLLSGDGFFDMKIIGRKLGGNWDHPGAVSHDTFFNCISELLCCGTVSHRGQEYKLASSEYIILEGYMLFYDPRIVNLIDVKFWLDIDKETCHQRRMSTTRVPEQYFQELLWPHYVYYRNYVIQIVPQEQIFDGTRDRNEIISEILKIITPSQ